MFSWQKISHLIFPKFCAACGKEGFGICRDCMNAFPPPEDALPLPEWAMALWSYRDKGVRATIRQLKYRRRKFLAGELSEPLFQKILSQFPKGDYILAPIPLSKERLRERGFNQAELLAKEIAKRDEGNQFLLEKTPFLCRAKNTPHQSLSHSREERKRNMAGAFFVLQTEKIRGKKIILIDDVITTGATISEARRALIHAGAKEVSAAALAH